MDKTVVILINLSSITVYKYKPIQYPVKAITPKNSPVRINFCLDLPAFGNTFLIVNLFFNILHTTFSHLLRYE
ncbi:hypothetical protein DRF67_09060 [Chryseobacterium pennipullorum]|uniref:Uncharacterized protein n=1 Tax=Chryseobacterium pennipullorum TaxID=2258963 RepID=A0A3D9B3D0_9FLAO|nr:hypothetical protein DRF67_09060 [Chryseobacterium pennipullorum]